MSRFEVSSKDSCARASWFCKGVVRKTKLPYLLKNKEMIMPGIMSEGSGAGSDPKCGARKGTRSVLRGVWGQRRLAIESLYWHGTEGRRGPFCFATSGKTVGGGG